MKDHQHDERQSSEIKTYHTNDKHRNQRTSQEVITIKGH